MKKNNAETDQERPLEAMVLEHQKDRYKLSYAALRWAKEIKQKENLPESVPQLIPRALREILTGKTAIKDIEKLPPIVKMAPPPAPAAPSTPTLTLNLTASEGGEPGKGE